MPLPEQVIEMSELTVWGVEWESCQQCELIGVMDGGPTSLSEPSSLLWRFSRGACISLPPSSGLLRNSSVPSVTHPWPYETGSSHQGFY